MIISRGSDMLSTQLYIINRDDFFFSTIYFWQRALQAYSNDYGKEDMIDGVKNI